MEITLTVNGKPVKATVDEKEMKEAMAEKKEKRTGYGCFTDGYIVTERWLKTAICCTRKNSGTCFRPLGRDGRDMKMQNGWHKTGLKMAKRERYGA